MFGKKKNQVESVVHHYTDISAIPKCVFCPYLYERTREDDQTELALCTAQGFKTCASVYGNEICQMIYRELPPPEKE